MASNADADYQATKAKITGLKASLDEIIQRIKSNSDKSFDRVSYIWYIKNQRPYCETYVWQTTGEAIIKSWSPKTYKYILSTNDLLQNIPLIFNDSLIQASKENRWFQRLVAFIDSLEQNLAQIYEWMIPSKAIVFLKRILERFEQIQCCLGEIESQMVSVIMNEEVAHINDCISSFVNSVENKILKPSYLTEQTQSDKIFTISCSCDAKVRFSTKKCSLEMKPNSTICCGVDNREKYNCFANSVLTFSSTRILIVSLSNLLASKKNVVSFGIQLKSDKKESSLGFVLTSTDYTNTIHSDEELKKLPSCLENDDVLVLCVDYEKRQLNLSCSKWPLSSIEPIQLPNHLPKEWFYNFVCNTNGPTLAILNCNELQ